MYHVVHFFFLCRNEKGLLNFVSKGIAEFGQKCLEAASTLTTNIRRYKATKIHTLTPLTFEVFFSE